MKDEIAKDVALHGQRIPALVERVSKHRYRLIDGLSRLNGVGPNGNLLCYIKDGGNTIHDIPVPQIKVPKRA